MSGPDLAARTGALESAASVGAGRLDPALVDDARAVVRRARERGGLSAEHTVVALAGATGSGKSSVFNAVAGAGLASAGVQRPTTSHALAAVWGAGADPLLDWLDVPRRHAMAATPVHDDADARPEFPPDARPDARPATLPDDAPTTGGPRRGLLRRTRDAVRTPAGPATGLVLLDLPDHDSVVVEHRVRAERLVERADLLVWVVDPQKYADAALHERYLRPLAGRADVVVVALNQVDRLAPDEADAVLADLRRLVAADGLGGARVLAVSARTGQGMDDLRGLLADAAARREAATARLTADVRDAGRRLADACGEPRSAKDRDRARAVLLDALEQAAAVPTVVDAVRVSALRDARSATGWPVTRWLGALRADPLRRLGLRTAGAGGRTGRRGAGAADRSGAGPDDRPDLVRTSLPAAAPATRAAAATAVRAYVDGGTAGLPAAWALAARERVADAAAALPDALDQAVAAARPDAERRPGWWRAVGALQWLLLAALVAGLLWLAGLAVLGYLRLPDPPLPVWGEVPWPTVLAVGGALAGVVVALLSRVASGVGARRRAARVRRRLRSAVSDVADRLVRGPVGDELSALDRCRAAARVAAS